jgi:CDP-glucose 4,6-dehydratase
MADSKGFWSERRVLVTGATGFLGGWLVRRLLDEGASVVAPARSLVRPSQFSRTGLAARCEVPMGDLSDARFVASLFEGAPYAAIFHTAAVADVRVALQDPVACFRSAIDSTMYFLEQIRTRSPSTVMVTSSSDKAYGPQPTPYREDSGLRPNHPYEVAKAAQDMMTQSYGKVFKLPVCVTRCANYFGGWELNLTRIVPDAILCALDRRPLVLRSDGRFTRDFIHVEEGAKIQTDLARRLIEKGDIKGEAFNFSYEVEIDIIALAEKIFALAGINPGIRVDNTAQAEIRHMRVDTAKAHEMLGWRPERDLDQALAQTIDWYRNWNREGA